MPNRIVRESINTSSRVDQLDPPAEVFYRRLINVVDDYGRYDARPAILKAACFPLRSDKIREADISRWIAICEKAGLIVLYEVESKPYLVLLNLGEPRAKRSKYPDPPKSVLRAHANICAQMISDAPVFDSALRLTPIASRAAARGGGRGQRWEPKDILSEDKP